MQLRVWWFAQGQSRAINVGIDWSIDFESKISKNIDFDIDINFELD